MAFIIVETPDIDIWKDNPSLELISTYKQFKDKEGHDRSSNILKAIYYIWDPKSNLKDSGISEDQLREDVTTNLIKDPDFNWDDYDYVKDLYLSTNITVLESLLIRYEKEISDLNAILASWPWDKKNISDRANAMKQYKVLFEEFISIKEKANLEAEELTEMYGGYTKSMVEDFGGQ